MSYVGLVEPSPYAPPYPTEPPAGSRRPARPQARMGIVTWTAVLTALVAIAAAANQWVARQMEKVDGQGRLYFESWLNYRWRFTSGPWSTRLWGAQFALIGTVLVLTGLLVWALLRGPVSWVRAFLGTWTAVLFATVVGAFVRALVAPDDFGTLPGASRVTTALFGPYGPGAGAVFAGVVLGLVVALVTSLLAVATRRVDRADEPRDGSGGLPVGPPAFADYAPPPRSASAELPPWQDKHFGPPAGEHPTTRLTPPDEERAERPDGEPTTQLPQPEPVRSRPAEQDAPTVAAPVAPAGEPPAGEQAGERSPAAPPPNQPPPNQPPPNQPPANQPPAAPPSAPAGEQATTRFPRPPDDEDLGHIDH